MIQEAGTKPFNVRIPVNILTRMQKAKEQHQRTFTSLIIAGIERELDDLGDDAHSKKRGSSDPDAALSI